MLSHHLLGSLYEAFAVAKSANDSVYPRLAFKLVSDPDFSLRLNTGANVSIELFRL